MKITVSDELDGYSKIGFFYSEEQGYYCALKDEHVTCRSFLEELILTLNHTGAYNLYRKGDSFIASKIGVVPTKKMQLVATNRFYIPIF